MSILRHFFRIDSDKTLFDGLKISENKTFCEKYQGNYPVIALSLKEASEENFKQGKYIKANSLKKKIYFMNYKPPLY